MLGSSFHYAHNKAAWGPTKTEWPLLTIPLSFAYSFKQVQTSEFKNLPVNRLRKAMPGFCWVGENEGITRLSSVHTTAMMSYNDAHAQ